MSTQSRSHSSTLRRHSGMYWKTEGKSWGPSSTQAPLYHSSYHMVSQSLGHCFFWNACPLGHDPTCTQGLPQSTRPSKWMERVGRRSGACAGAMPTGVCGFSKRTRTHVPSRKWKWKKLQEVRTDWVSLWKNELVHVRSLVQGKWKCVRDHEKPKTSLLSLWLASYRAACYKPWFEWLSSSPPQTHQIDG